MLIALIKIGIDGHPQLPADSRGIGCLLLSAVFICPRKGGGVIYGSFMMTVKKAVTFAQTSKTEKAAGHIKILKHADCLSTAKIKEPPESHHPAYMGGPQNRLSVSGKTECE
ncbi:hypothetical protein UZ38_30905 [Bacillus amyloliquefaciens]|nr:hypothetical protein UZ38_30905 [Bacillus amyloliquefaciens]